MTELHTYVYMHTRPICVYYVKTLTHILATSSGTERAARSNIYDYH